MKVIAIPRNGLGNRLQALASAHLLATQLGAEFEVIWATQEILKSEINSLIATIPNAVLHTKPSALNVNIKDIPLFTNFDRRLNRITLNNQRLGDQRYSDLLSRFISESNDETEIWIYSGEKFKYNESTRFCDSKEFIQKRSLFYSNLIFTDSILKRVAETQDAIGNIYWAIHLRSTDRKSEKISDSKIVEKIIQERETNSSLSNNVYIASDELDTGFSFSERLSSLGFVPIFMPSFVRDRLKVEETEYSLTDWLLLSQAQRIVSYGGTTFSYEAAVAGNSFEDRIFIEQSRSRKISQSWQRNYLNFKLYKKLPVLP